MYRNIIKCVLDVYLSMFLLHFVLIEIVLLEQLVYFEDHGSIFYKAKRRGLNGEIFSIYKLRSM
jgi:undecaprenyl phosphate N,N'-diacetylbacillosamine 1-phosphate transferase